MLYGTEIRTKHSRNYMRAFEKLRRLARNCDVDRIIEDTLMQAAFGLLYERMVTYDPESTNGDPSTGGQ